MKRSQFGNFMVSAGFLNQYVCLQSILPFSKLYPEIEGTRSTPKFWLRKSFDKWYYIVICATLCVRFSSKSKATNIFPKHILKSKSRDKSNQAGKKLFCHVIVKNYFFSALCQFWFKIESMWEREIKEQASQMTLLYCDRAARSSHQRCSIKKAVLKNFAISTGNTCVGISFLKSYRSKGLQLY